MIKTFTGAALCLNLVLISLLVTVYLFTNYKYMGHPYAEARGQVTKTLPTEHAIIFSDFVIGGKIYSCAESGDCKKFGPGDVIPIYYRLDNPGISSYDESRYSTTKVLAEMVVLSAILSAFIWVVGSRVFSYIQRTKKVA